MILVLFRMFGFGCWFRYFAVCLGGFVIGDFGWVGLRVV